MVETDYSNQKLCSSASASTSLLPPLSQPAMDAIMQPLNEPKKRVVRGCSDYQTTSPKGLHA